jgi:hypothetical protein
VSKKEKFLIEIEFFSEKTLVMEQKEGLLKPK